MGRGGGGWEVGVGRWGWEVGVGAGIEVLDCGHRRVQEDHSAFWKFPCSSIQAPRISSSEAGNEF